MPTPRPEVRSASSRVEKPDEQRIFRMDSLSTRLGNFEPQFSRPLNNGVRIDSLAIVAHLE